MAVFHHHSILSPLCHCHLLGSLQPSIHPLLLSLTFAGLELRGHGEESLVLDVQLGVELGEDEDLRPPVLGVRRPVLQAQQAEAGGRQGQAPQAVTPLLLGPAGGKTREQVSLRAWSGWATQIPTLYDFDLSSFLLPLSSLV